jgi:hypothetical protein
MKEAMKLALEAVKELHRTGDTQVFDMYYAQPVIKALEEALAKQEQGEPVLLIQSHRDGFWCVDLTCKKCYSADFRFKHKNSVDKESLTTSQQRTWVGLTDEELEPLCKEWRVLFGSWTQEFAKAIEAKLKEKNT